MTQYKGPYIHGIFCIHVFIMPKCDVCGKNVKNLAKHKRRKRCSAKKYPTPTLDQLRNRISHGW